MIKTGLLDDNKLNKRGKLEKKNLSVAKTLNHSYNFFLFTKRAEWLFLNYNTLLQVRVLYRNTFKI